MKKTLKKGFTLLELLFVMAVISIIIGIGISDMSESTNVAKNTVAKADVRNGISEAYLYYAQNGTYEGFTSSLESVNVVEATTNNFCIEVNGSNVNYKFNSATDGAISEGTCGSGPAGTTPAP